MPDAATAHKLIRLLRFAIPRLGPIVPQAIQRAETHLVLVLDVTTSVLVPRMTDEERALFTHEYSAHVVTITRVRELVIDGAEETLTRAFDMAMAQSRPPGSLMVVVAIDAALGFQIIEPEAVQALLTHRCEVPIPAVPHVCKADGRASLLAMLNDPLPEELDAARLATLQRYRDLARGIEAAEACKDPPGDLGTVLFEMFDGAALEAAIDAAFGKGDAEEARVFQVMAAAVERVSAQMAAA